MLNFLPLLGNYDRQTDRQTNQQTGLKRHYVNVVLKSYVLFSSCEIHFVLILIAYCLYKNYGTPYVPQNVNNLSLFTSLFREHQPDHFPALPPPN